MDKLSLYIAKNQWVKAEKLCREKITKNPNEAHWWQIHLGLALLEQKKFTEAEQTFELASGIGFCPLTQWYKACLKYDQLKYDESLEILLKLYQRCRRWLKSSQCIKCWESEKKIKEMFNDCRAKIGFCYFNIGKNNLAIRWWLLHLQNRKKGQGSVYSAKTIKKYVKLKRKTDKEVLNEYLKEMEIEAGPFYKFLLIAVQKAREEEPRINSGFHYIDWMNICDEDDTMDTFYGPDYFKED